MEQIIDLAVKDFLDQLGKAQEEFLKDIEQLEEEGLSMEEIMVALGVLSIAEYFIEDLGMNVAINKYMASIDNLLDDLFMFGRITESQLQALRLVQEQSITAYVNELGEKLRVTILQGVTNNLPSKEMRDLIQRNADFQLSAVDKVVGDGLATFNRSVVAVMIVGSPPGRKLWYLGPLDSRTRPICRKMIAAGELTASQVSAQFPGALSEAGGINCRHVWTGVDGTNARIKQMTRAKREMKQIDRKRFKKGLKPLKYQTYEEYVQSTQIK